MKQDDMHKGLSTEEVLASRREHGENVLTPPKQTSLWTLFLEKFNDPIIRILLIAWVLSMIIAGVHCWGEGQGFSAFLEPIGIFFAILLASGVGFIFEVRANKAFNILNTVNDDAPVRAIRDGAITEIMKREVVVGDYILLETGEEIPADGVLIEAISLQVNESTLTGEPLADKTTNEAFFDLDATYPSNVVMRGTSVVDGHGLMIVEQVGDATGYGKVYEGAQIDNNVDTPLQIQLAGLANVISKAGYTIAGLTFVALVVKMFLTNQGLSTVDMIGGLLNIFMISVTLIVVSVPEGLPMSVTLSLALSMNRMLKANNLVRKMHAVETMGATTVICTDKTGTLTENQMRVSETKFTALPDEQQLDDSEASRLIAEGIAVNTTAFLEDKEGVISPIGNPTEGALLLWLDKQQQDYLALRQHAPVVSQQTFSTERKYMATIVQSEAIGKTILYVKGAPEIVLSYCNRVAYGDTYRPVNEVQPTIEQDLLGYQHQAMRTLGFAYQVIEQGTEEQYFKDGLLHQADLTFLGVVAISDPVRADVPAAVQTCLDAGIDVKIVTGDTAETAKEIGRQIGIWQPDYSDYNILTGPGFEALDDEEALSRVLDLKIMCRARPTDKQRLVRLLQDRDQVVAVTGDGTNDAPALKAAQVGLSMGDGTAVAKEASDITILDNSFSSITLAVMWGRSLYRNIQKFLLFQLTINVSACLIVLFGSLIGTQSPLTITQMLWVNLIMDTFAAAALASLPPQAAVMKDRPRKSGPKGDFIVTRGMSSTIFSMGICFVVMLLGLLYYFNQQPEGLTPYRLSYFFTAFVMIQFWNMFNAKAFGTNKSAFADLKDSKTFLSVALLILVGQYVIVTFGKTMFSVVPLSWEDWGILFGGSSIVLWGGEIIRFYYRIKKKYKVRKA